MGIPKYHKWLTERYPEAFAEAQQEEADHVYVDINTLLHTCMRHASSKDGFYQHLFAKLDSLFRIVVPTKSVFLAVDGPASCAKCLTQRQRRRAHAQKDAKTGKGTGKGKGKRGKKGGGKEGQTEQLSNNMLTPGVPFMSKLTSALEYYAASRLTRGSRFGSCQAATVSGALAIGEGEHKIVSQMLRNAAACAAEGAPPESHVISSGDADIFLLSLVQSACRRVRVVSEREMQDGKRRRGATLEIWNAEVLARCIQSELAPGKRAPSCSDEAALRRDFSLIALLAGNDYLPELKCVLSPQQLWDRYLQLRRKQFPSTSLVQCALTEEGLPFSHLEGGWANALGDTGAAFTSEPYEHFSFNMALLSKFMTAAAGGSAAPSSLSGPAAEGVRKYLEGLLWILEMYHHGYCGDFYFVLEKSLHTFASARLISQFILCLDLEAAETLTPPRSEYPPMRPVSCAICILPVQDAERFLCPKAPELRPMFAVEHPLLGSVNAIERNETLRHCKQQVAALQQEMMRLREQGEDDREVKGQLTMAQRQMEEIKKGASDIDVVPLSEVDAEVAELCASTSLPELDFSPDVTLVRAEGEPFTLEAPVRGWGPLMCKGLAYVAGEWPQTGETAAVEAGTDGDEAAAGEELDEAGEEMQLFEVEEPEDATVEEEGAPAFDVGQAVQAYWPEDDEYLPATITEVHADGSFQIVWSLDGSESKVPADYLQAAAEEELDLEEPSPKRARVYSS